VGTFSKSFAAVGGFVAGDEYLVHYLKHTARALMFSASLPPSNVASVIAALDIIEREPQRMKRLGEIADKMRREFQSRGFDVGTSITPIVPILMGDNMKAFKMWKLLFEKGVFTTPVVSPAVPSSRAMIRTSYSATHQEEHLNKVIHAFEEAGKELGVI
ncbi:aminotransferase class I/II-fold pyridoxal phosphate-dependent enzyme, partial [bacterium]